jgi:thiamine pyrophosphate-dependent acetolactate synthase large subunit-like protein
MKMDLATISMPDLGAVGAAFGGRGRMVRSVEELRGAVKEWLAKPGPMLVDARISRSVITLPYRRIHYGRDE